jgi:succinoglycan biosynthesis transport protein ExoP
MLQSLHLVQDQRRPQPAWDQDRPLSEVVDVDKLHAAIRRQWRVVASCVVAAVAMGLAYIATAVPLYTADTEILIDQSSAKIVEELSQVGATEATAPELISQVEILSSDNLAFAVVDALDLSNNPKFMQDGESITGWIKKSLRGDGPVASRLRGILEAVPPIAEWLKPGDPPTPAALRLAAMWRLQSGLQVDRAGDSFVLNISFTAKDPELAAKIVDAVADAYLSDQITSKYAASRRANSWFEQHLQETRQSLMEANVAVQRYRAERGLVGARGELLSDQQVSEVSTQLILAQADTAQAKARLDRIQAIMNSDAAEALVSDALESGVISELRTAYLNAARQASDIVSAFGDDHPNAVRLRGEMQEYQRQIREELGRIAESYRSEYEVAKSRQDSLRANLEAATGASFSANRMLAELTDLEQTAEAYSELYRILLQRQQQAMRQQSFPVSEARIISPAIVPKEASHPKSTIILALAGTLGMMLGVMIAGYRELTDSSFRNGDQVRDDLGLDFFGFTPAISKQRRFGRNKELQTVAERPRFITAAHASPLFTDTLRGAKVALDIALDRKRPMIVGVTSVLPGEGKTTIATTFAELLVGQGTKTLLIDGDLRTLGLTSTLPDNAAAGLFECITENVSLGAAVLQDSRTKLAVLPASSRRQVPHAGEVLASPGMASVLAQAARSYEYVVIDLPPITSVVDVRAIAGSVDAFVLVVEWGSTPRRLVRAALQAEPLIAARCVGSVLNRLDLSKLSLYRPYASKRRRHAISAPASVDRA